MNPSATPLLRLLGACALALALAAPALAQRTVTIEPGPPGTLNNTIAGDTTATGERTDPNTEYVLRRGAVYIYNSQLRANYNLTIRAEDGAGPRPVIQAAFTGSGEAPRPFRVTGEGVTFNLSGVYVYGVDNAGVQTDNAMVRIGANDVTLNIDDVHFDGNRLSAVRVDNDGANITVTNSVFSHIFNLDTAFGWNIFVNVGINVGDIIVRNTTFYNSNGLILNNAGTAEYTEFRNVTVHNAGVALDFTDVIDGGQTAQFVFRDNIVYNGGYYGNSPARVERFVIDSDTLFIDTDGNPDTPDEEQPINFDIANGNLYFDPAIAAVYPDSVTQRPLFGNAVQAYLDETAGREGTFFSERLDFASPPSTAALIARLEYVYANGSEQGAPFLDRDPRAPANTPAQPGLTAAEQLPVDFAYPTTARSYTAGTNGCPLGDLNWFDDAAANACRQAVPNEDGPGGVGALRARIAPNPASGVAAVLVDLDAASAVTVSLYDVLGRRVSLVEATMPAGAAQRVGIDVSGLPSGAYIVRVEAESGSGLQATTQRVTVVR